MRIRTLIGVASASGAAAVAAGLGGAAALAAGAEGTEPAGLIFVETTPAATADGTGTAAQWDCPETDGAVEAPAPETL